MRWKQLLQKVNLWKAKMYKLSQIIGEYEEPDLLSNKTKVSGMPIESPKGLDWNKRENPTRLTKLFKFKNETNFNTFVMDVLEHQAETQHHGRITLQYPQVKIEVWTHSLNDLTEIDFEWASAVSEIYEGYEPK